ncbi:AT-hook motif nuclear-localized protein 21-like [Curcuma longa]|uniref:AT-hook motif nuclear-localized protein 21-like n=1 Tax=Curcuma longa TaxID=136217 RepID=UPI003D9EE75D
MATGNSSGSKGRHNAANASSWRPRRGRPLGSKNKKKPPVIITRESPDALRPHMLEIASGTDIVAAVSALAARGQRGLCVLSGRGGVADVTLRQPWLEAAAASVTLPGRFEIVSLDGAFLPAPAPLGASGLAVTVASRGTGQVMGGNVIGKLIAAGTVYVISASFGNVAYERWPADDEAGASDAGTPLRPPP